MQQIPKEKFRFVQRNAQISDERLQTKTVGYLGDAWNRFRTNKSAVVAFVLIMILLLYALIVPVFSHYTVGFRDGYYKMALPKSEFFARYGFWDGGKNEHGATFYNLRSDSYNSVGFVFANLSESEYQKLMAYQEESGIQVFYPLPATLNKHFVRATDGANFWYVLQDESQGTSGAPKLDENGRAPTL